MIIDADCHISFKKYQTTRRRARLLRHQRAFRLMHVQLPMPRAPRREVRVEEKGESRGF